MVRGWPVLLMRALFARFRPRSSLRTQTSSRLGGADANASRACDNAAEATRHPGRPRGRGPRPDRPPPIGATPWPPPTATCSSACSRCRIGLIDQGQLVAAFQAWTRDKARPLADHLVARGDLDADDRAAVEALVARHLKKHGGDAEKSLAADPAPAAPPARAWPRSATPTSRPPSPTSAPASTEPTTTPTAPPPTPSARPPADGQRFRVLRPHARGGLGAVFVALDDELHREVALKQILDHHADDPTSRQRFLLEAEITGGLEHPGIVPVYGLGTYGDGRPYYAMRFIRGDSLKEAIERFHADEALKDDPGRRSLELRKLLRRFLDVCNAIDYAHSRGVLHRDIKPGNIIVGKHGETLVVDWGLAKAAGRAEPGVGRRADAGAQLGQRHRPRRCPGSALGTPAYMSPEQAAGDLERLGPRSRRLQPRRHALLPADRQAAVRGRRRRRACSRAVQRGEFPPPRQLDPAIDRALEAVCLKAMAPAARGPLRLGPGAGRGRRAVDGRRAGLGLPRAVRGGGPAAGRGGTGRRSPRGGAAGRGGPSAWPPAPC